MNPCQPSCVLNPTSAQGNPENLYTRSNTQWFYGNNETSLFGLHDSVFDTSHHPCRNGLPICSQPHDPKVRLVSCTHAGVRVFKTILRTYVQRAMPTEWFTKFHNFAKLS